MSNNGARSAFIFFVICITSLAGCKKTRPFNGREWNDGDGIDFPKRYMMVDDLLAKHKLKGMTYKQVILLLKYPQRNSHTDRSFYYDITLNMHGIDTAYFKGLLFTLNKDSIVTDVRIFEKTAKKKEKK